TEGVVPSLHVDYKSIPLVKGSSARRPNKCRFLFRITQQELREAVLTPRRRSRPTCSLCLLLLCFGCSIIPSTAERVSDAARELNLALRFGRMDVAVERVERDLRSEFVSRHALWGRALRVVDVELTGLSMEEPTQALVLVDVSWVRSDETTLRTTRIAQTWKDGGGGWVLVRERRVEGDVGVFGTPTTALGDGGDSLAPLALP
ncbi:MAG TPA: hypothetical protein VGJ84_13860, partial [Polyangiaceae bacterium]